MWADQFLEVLATLAQQERLGADVMIVSVVVIRECLGQKLLAGWYLGLQ